MSAPNNRHRSSSKKRRSDVAVVAAVVLAGVVAVAEQRGARAESDQVLRVALLIANNAGTAGRAPLRYAEEDAERLAQVLTELGGFGHPDVHLVQGQRLPQVQGALDQIKARIATAHAQGRRTVLLFYFSGHSDGQALEIGRDRWLFGDVKRRLHDVGADIRIAIVDSCRSGALLAEKGGTAGPAFDIRFTDDLETIGEAVLTSSAANELALESREIRASFFSHHLVSGLRGAADASGDGRVTLGEAYRYAFENTLLATADTLNGPQHPVYDYRLTGKGELVLTDVLAHGATLELPAAFERILIADASRQHLVAEITSLSNRRVALPAGRYLLHARRAGRAHEVEITLRDGESRAMTAPEFTAREGAVSFIKGDDPAVLSTSPAPAAPVSRSDLAVEAGLGVTRGAAAALPWLGALHAGAAAEAPTHVWSLSVDLAQGRAVGFRERAAYLGLGYARPFRRGRFAAQLGARLAGGPLVQTVDGVGSFWSVALGAGPHAAAAVDVVPSRITIGAEVSVDGMLLRRDGAFEPALWPSGALTLGARL
jgi:hypothetical protein